MQKAIVNPAVLTFDPSGTLAPELEAVWSDDIARTIWLAYKQVHITNQHFESDCLALAQEIRRGPVETGRELYLLAASVSRTSFQPEGDAEWWDLLLPFIRGRAGLGWIVREETPTYTEVTL